MSANDPKQLTEFFAPEIPCDPIERTEHKTSGDKRQKSAQEAEGASEEGPRTMGRNGGNQPEGREQRIENGAQNVEYARAARQRQRV